MDGLINYFHLGFGNHYVLLKTLRINRSGIMEIDGNNIIYHHLQKDLKNNDLELFQKFIVMVINDLGIWFSPEVYQLMPILRPYVVRDSNCRRRQGGVEAWGAPDENGYLRDDNSLIKDLPNSLYIHSPKKYYNGNRIGKGFTASHIWRAIKYSKVRAKLASNDPMLNSFVPNLVWLPKQVAKLTDREGSFAQLYLQSLSLKIYRNQDVSKELNNYVEEAWKMLKRPEIPEKNLPEIKELSFFQPTNRFFNNRKNNLLKVCQAFESLKNEEPINGRVITTRYKEGLPALEKGIFESRFEEFNAYYQAITQE